MANKKQKEAAELLVEKNRDFDQLSVRVNEIEAELKRYKEREADIAAAMTMAAQAKANIISEAERTAQATVRNAEKKAEATVSEAEKKAAEMIKNAEQKATEILTDAQDKATKLTEKTQKETQTLLSSAKAESDKLMNHCTSINAVLLQAAASIYEYISDYKDTYEDLTGNKISDLIQVKSEATNMETPDSYETPEELFHTVMKMKGRNTPKKVKADSPIPASIPFSDTFFDNDDPKKNIESILNMDSAPQQTPYSPKVPEVNVDMSSEIHAEKSMHNEKPTDIKAELAEHIDAILSDENNSMGLTGKPSSSDESTTLKATESEAEMLSAILDDFMNNVVNNAEPLKIERPNLGNDNPNVNDKASDESEEKPEAELEEFMALPDEKVDEPTEEVLNEAATVTEKAKDLSTEVSTPSGTSTTAKDDVPTEDSDLSDMLNDIIDDKNEQQSIAPAPDDLNAILSDIFGKLDFPISDSITEPSEEN